MIKSGVLMLDKAKPQDSTVNVTIQMDTLQTAVPELNKHLESPLFFDVAKYPTATFVSNKVVLTGKTTAKVQGILTFHGVSKPITLNVKLNKIGENPISNENDAGFDATTSLKRSDYVKIDISAEADRAN